MERKDTEQRKFRIKRQFPKYEPLIPRERLKLIYRAAEIVARQDESKKKANEALVDQLVSSISALDLLFNRSRDFLRGDSEARHHLIALLNYILKRAGIQGRPPSERKQGRPISGTGKPKEGNPQASGYAMLMPPGLTGGQPCLVPPLRIADIFVGVLRICAEDPRIGGGENICPDYLIAVGSLVEMVSDLEMFYAAATDVVKRKDSKAFPYFEATLDIMRHSDFEGVRAEPRLFSFKFGNPDGIPIALDRPQLFTDPCTAARWDETAAAVICFRELWAGPRYEIQDIRNITPGHEGVSRKGCLGDEIEIQGRNLEVLREIVFPVRITVTEYTMWENERIRFIIPEGARAGLGDISICIDPGIAACTRLNACRLAERGTDHSFTVVEPPTIEEFSANSERDQVEVEACTDVVLYLHAIAVERATLTDSRGTEVQVWDFGEGPPQEIRERHTIRNLRNSETYTLEVRNLCGAVTERVQVDVYYALHLSSATRRIDTGDSVNLTVRVSCPMEGEALRVRIDSTRPDNVSVPGEVEIPVGSRQTEVEATALSPGIARITAAVNRYREAALDLQVDPVIDSISPSRQYLNEEITIEGRGFQPGSTFVRFQGADRVPAEVSDANTLTVTVPNDADDGNVSVEVTEDGEPFPSNRLRFEVLPPELTSIEPPAQVRGGSVSLIGRGFSTIEDHNEILFTGPSGEIAERSPSHGPSSGRRLDNVIVPSNQGAITGPARVVAEGRESNTVEFHLLREEGRFYEVRTVIEDSELDDLPIVRTCGASREVRIELIAANQFTATFYVDGNQVGVGLPFRRHQYGLEGSPMVGGTAISERHCSVGVVIDAPPGSDEITAYLVNTDTGVVLFPDGSNSFPKLVDINPIEPRIWFNQDDTVAMIIAASIPVAGELNLEARFIDIISGEAIRAERFRLPEPILQEPPYSARIENNVARSQIVFSVEENEVFRIDVP